MALIARLSRGLERPLIYRLFSWLVGNPRYYRTVVREFLGVEPGARLLDIGCGPAAILPYLPGVQYTGLDVSREYIAEARKRFGDRGKFLVHDVSEPFRLESQFDRVIASGVVHHLSDAEATCLFSIAGRALVPGGILVTVDGCRVPGQSGVKKWLLNSDRGRHVRDQAGYEILARSSFERVESRLRSDLLRIPYDHVVLRCTKK